MSLEPKEPRPPQLLTPEQVNAIEENNRHILQDAPYVGGLYTKNLEFWRDSISGDDNAWWGPGLSDEERLFLQGLHSSAINTELPFLVNRPTTLPFTDGKTIHLYSLRKIDPQSNAVMPLSETEAMAQVTINPQGEIIQHEGGQDGFDPELMQEWGPQLAELLHGVYELQESFGLNDATVGTGTFLPPEEQALFDRLSVL
jgi:hypothetical protein